MDLFRSSEFESRVNELMRRHHVPGLAIAVVSGQETASQGFGLANVSQGTPCTADTLFDIASCSKSLTAASVALLVDDEKFPDVRWDAILSQLLPGDFEMSDPEYTRSVTVDDVIGHRTGLPGHDLSYMSPRADEPDDARSVTRNVRNLAIAAPIRSKYIYCNLMYTVATHLVEVKTGLKFHDFLQSNFFEPLSMAQSFLQPSSAEARGFGHLLAQGHHWDKKTKAYRQFDTPDCPDSQGAGSIITSANDYIKWVKALINQEFPITERIYSHLTRLRSITSPNTKALRPHMSPIFYTAGLEVYWYRGHMVVGHDGGIAGFGSRHFFVPDIQLGAVIFGNAEEAADITGILSRELIDEALGVPADQRNHKIPKGLIHPRPSDRKIPARPKQQSTLGLQGIGHEELRLERYAGIYHNSGYHNMVVQAKGGQLFIDATDRSMGFTLTLDHKNDGTDFVAHFCDFLDGTGKKLAATFELAGENVVALGLDLEKQLKDKIWFARVEAQVESEESKNTQPISN